MASGITRLTGLPAGMRGAVEWWIAVLEGRGYSLQIVSGFRSNAEQLVLYQKGRTPTEVAQRVKKLGRGGAVTDAYPGTSPHNYGLAVDIEELHGRTQEIHDLAASAGWGVVSWDPPHIEWPGWRKYV